MEIATAPLAADEAPRMAVGAGVAEELRRRRRLLHLSLRQAARRTGVTYSVISSIENGRRVPSVRTYERLRAGLGLEASAASLIVPRPQTGLVDEHLVRLAACVVVQRGGTLATLAAALGISIPAVREGLSAIGERLAAVGLRAVEDGDVVRVAPAPAAATAVAAVASLQPLPEISTEQLEVVAIVAHLGSATRREIERLRGEDSESLVRRLVERGLLEKVGETPGGSAPNIYRITAAALAITGHATVESLQTFLDQAVAAPEGPSRHEEQRGLLSRPSAAGGGSPGEASRPRLQPSTMLVRPSTQRRALQADSWAGRGSEPHPPLRCRRRSTAGASWALPC